MVIYVVKVKIINEVRTKQVFTELLQCFFLCIVLSYKRAHLHIISKINKRDFSTIMPSEHWDHFQDPELPEELDCDKHVAVPQQ